MDRNVTIKYVTGVEVTVNPLFRNSNARRVKIWTNGENEFIEPFSFVGICAEPEHRINLPTAQRIPILAGGKLFKIEFSSLFYPEDGQDLFLNARLFFWVSAHYEPLYIATIYLTPIKTERAILSTELSIPQGLA